MTCVGRLAGALLVETKIAGEMAWFLVGDTKVPCDFEAAGFVRPAERDVLAAPFVRLVPQGKPRLTGACLALSVEGEPAARLVADRLLVSRNGSVSERLWRLIWNVHSDDGDEPALTLDARWLAETPGHVWNVVRDAVLKCT